MAALRVTGSAEGGRPVILQSARRRLVLTAERQEEAHARLKERAAAQRKEREGAQRREQEVLEKLRAQQRAREAEEAATIFKLLLSIN